MLPNRSASCGDRASFALRWSRFIGQLGQRYQCQEGVVGLFFRSGLPGPHEEDVGELAELVGMEAPDLRMAAASLLQRTVLAAEMQGPRASGDSRNRPFGEVWLATPEEAEVAALADLVELEAPNLRVPLARLLQIASMVDERIVFVMTTLAEVHAELGSLVPGSTLAAFAAHSDLRRLASVARWSVPSEVLGEDHAVEEDLLRLAQGRGLLSIAAKLERGS